MLPRRWTINYSLISTERPVPFEFYHHHYYHRRHRRRCGRSCRHQPNGLLTMACAYSMPTSSLASLYIFCQWVYYNSRTFLVNDYLPFFWYGLAISDGRPTFNFMENGEDLQIVSANIASNMIAWCTAFDVRKNVIFVAWILHSSRFLIIDVSHLQNSVCTAIVLKSFSCVTFVHYLNLLDIIPHILGKVNNLLSTYRSYP